MTPSEYAELLRLRFFARSVIHIGLGPHTASDNIPMKEDEMVKAWLAVDKLAKIGRKDIVEAGND